MKLAKSEPAKSVLAITVGFIIIYLATHWKGALTIATLVGLAGVLSSYLARLIDLVWTKLAKLLSLIVPNILLSAIFYLFLFPISLLSKLFGNKDPLRLKNKGASMYVDVNHKFDKASIEKPW